MKKEQEEVVDRWCDRLESGKYLQGVNNLHITGTDGDRFCCLGILCEMAVEDGVIPPARENRDGVFSYNNLSSSLPLEVMKYAGLNGDTGKFVNRYAYNGSLASMNDRGASFYEIAKLIHSRPKGMFV